MNLTMKTETGKSLEPCVT